MIVNLLYFREKNIFISVFTQFEIHSKWGTIIRLQTLRDMDKHNDIDMKKGTKVEITFHTGHHNHENNYTSNSP